MRFIFDDIAWLSGELAGGVTTLKARPKTLSSTSTRQTAAYDGLGHRASTVGTDGVDLVSVYTQGGQLLYLHAPSEQTRTACPALPLKVGAQRNLQRVGDKRALRPNIIPSSPRPSSSIGALPGSGTTWVSTTLSSEPP